MVRSQRRRHSKASPTRHIGRNRRFWNRTSDAYDARNREGLTESGGMAWGLWRIPESELRLLGAVRGRKVLELGCGAARWSAALARRGASAVGLDLSDSQLEKALQESTRTKGRVALVHGSAESLPFQSGGFDIVFCDWGAMTFADPRRTVPEVARVLAVGGRFVFSASSPFRYVALHRGLDRQTRRLEHAYFDIERLDLDGAVEFQLTYGAWVTLFRAHGLAVERLLETRPPRGRRSRYLSAGDEAWARRWPTEAIWSLRKERAARTVRRSARTSSRRPG